jgi:hypothetical protein
MYTEVTCSACQRKFYVQSEVADEFNNCPECLKGEKDGCEIGTEDQQVHGRGESDLDREGDGWSD